MLKSLFMVLLAACVCLAAEGKDPKDQNWKPTPLMRSVTPDSVKTGEMLTIAGDYLDKSRVKEIYLTNGKDEVKTEIVEQAATEVKVKVTASTKAGRYRLMVLTTGVEPQFLEQPVVVTVE